MVDEDIALQDMVPKKMMTNLDVLSLRVLYWVVGDLDCTLIVALEGHILHVYAVVSQGLLDPHQLSTAGSNNNVLSFGSGGRDTVLLL